MCGVPDHDETTALVTASDGPSRRGLLTAGVAAVAAARLGLGSAAAEAATPDTLRSVTGGSTNTRGETSSRAAMHLHGSFSEGNASHTQHLDQAMANGVDIVVRTDHDWRVQLRHYGGAFHFSGWKEETPSGYWELCRPRSSRTLDPGSSAELVGEHSPVDASPTAGALRLSVSSTDRSVATLALELSNAGSNLDTNGTVLGRQLHLQVRLDSATSERSYPAVRLTLARDPRYGLKTITYRLRGDLATAGAPVVVAGTATVDYPLQRGVWDDFAPDLLGDIRRCWPDLVAEDNSVNVVVLMGVGTRAEPLRALLSSFAFEADPDYDAATSYANVLDATGARYPQLLLPYGLEHSVDHHFGQIGGRPFFYPYPDGDPSTHGTFGDGVADAQMRMIVQHGGVGSYNHPFGAVDTDPRGTQRSAALSRVIDSVLRSRAYGADVLEVGYVRRGMDLAGHLELLDACAANRLYLTGVGVSDDHSGVTWAEQTNRFVTIPWLRRRDEPTLHQALRGGRAAAGLLGTFDGALDLSINGVARMGQVLAADIGYDDQLLVECYGAPSGSSLSLKVGPVDSGGRGFTRPWEFARLGAGALGRGPVSVSFPDLPACYVRAELVDAAGTTIAFTNPVWRLPAGDTAPADRLVRL